MFCIFEIPSGYGSSTWGEDFGETMSLPLLGLAAALLSFFCGGVVHLVFRSFSEEIIPYAAVDLW